MDTEIDSIKNEREHDKRSHQHLRDGFEYRSNSGKEILLLVD